jgi:hypothetical protein
LKVLVEEYGYAGAGLGRRVSCVLEALERQRQSRTSSRRRRGKADAIIERPAIGCRQSYYEATVAIWASSISKFE